MNNKKVKQLQKESISLLKFLKVYFGLNQLNDKITHDCAKELFPILQRYSFDELEKNIEQYYNGNILLVHDCKGNCIPYIKPDFELLIENDDETYTEISENSLEELEILNSELDTLKVYELLELRRKVKKNTSDYFKLTRKLSKKKDRSKILYKKKKNEMKYM